MNDYYATIRIQQGRIRASMERHGISTAAELSRLSGVQQNEIGRLLNFRTSPRLRSGKLRASARAICDALGEDVNDIFPDHLCHVAPTNRMAGFVEQRQIDGLHNHRQLTPYEECANTDRKCEVEAAMGCLNEREYRIIRGLFFEGKSQADMARETARSKPTVKIIERRALRKLRHPARRKILEAL